MTIWRRIVGSWGSRPRRVDDRPPSVVPEKACRGCRHFRDAPADIEAALPGLTSLGSGYASVRGDDGLCLAHDRFVSAHAICAAFSRRTIAPL